MTKAELVSIISKRTGVERQVVLTTVEAFMEEVKNSLEKGENVHLRGFGSFVVIVPVETEFGTKRAIDPFTCNDDLSCLAGCCPALVVVEGREHAGSHGLAPPEAALPEPELRVDPDNCSMLVAGVGGTGVVTLGALLGMAAHLEGRAVSVLDQTGMAQKGGAVLTHVRLAREPAALASPRIVRADVLLGADLLVAASDEALQRLRADRTHAVLNTAQAMCTSPRAPPPSRCTHCSSRSLRSSSIGAGSSSHGAARAVHCSARLRLQ